MNSDPRDRAAARHACDRDAKGHVTPARNADAVRMAIAKNLNEFSRSTDPQRIVARSLALIGTAIGASRIRINGAASRNEPARRYE
jgi:hypothetical protein